METRPADDSPLDLLRLIKGAPFTCLHAMCLAGAPVQARWLCEATGYSAGTVTQALKVLSSGGLVERLRGRSGWIPTPRLAAVGLAPVRNFCDHPDERDPDTTTTALKRKKHKPVVGTDRNRKIPDRLPMAEGGNDDTSCTVSVNSPADDKTKDYPTNDYPTDDLPSLAALRKVLRNAGIGEPKASYLAGLPYVTVEYACALHRKTRRLGQDARLLIYRIQQHDPMPERCQGGICPECIIYSATVGHAPVNRMGEPDQSIAAGFTSGAGSASLHPSLLLPAAPGSPFSLAQAWQEVVRDLLEQRPSANCQAYLRECLPSRYDPQLDRLTVLAADGPGRDWLQARLSTLLSRNLVGLCSWRVEIRFVAPGDETTG